MERDEPSSILYRILEILIDGLLDVVGGVESVEGSEVFVDLVWASERVKRAYERD